MVHEGLVSCVVTASAGMAGKNEVKIKEDASGVYVKVKSKTGMLSISDCVMNSNGVEIPINASFMIPSEKVEVKIEELVEDVFGNLGFSEYEAKGKPKTGKDPSVKLNKA